MFRGRAALGNDSPFAPIFPATDPDVPQRQQDLAEAKELMAAAGVPNGFQATLTTERYQEMPDYAVVIQNAVRKIGIDLTLNVEDQSAYYGRAVFGSSDWLDSEMGIEDYAHRGVPNTFLTASLGSRGTFNAAHFKNPEYDALVASYIAALDSSRAARLCRPHPAAAARGDPGDHRLFLRLAIGDGEAHQRRAADRQRPAESGAGARDSA